MPFQGTLADLSIQWGSPLFCSDELPRDPWRSSVLGLLAEIQHSRPNERSSDCLPGAAGLESGPARHQSGIRDPAEDFIIFELFLLNPSGISSLAEGPNASEIPILV